MVDIVISFITTALCKKTQRIMDPRNKLLGDFYLLSSTVKAQQR